MTARRRTALETEAEWQATVIHLAKLRGWLVHHQRPARTADGGWRSAIVGDRGWPDLALARGGRLILAELKSETGAVTPDQRRWLQELELVDQTTGGYAFAVYVWRPRDWPEVQAALR